MEENAEKPRRTKKSPGGRSWGVGISFLPPDTTLHPIRRPRVAATRRGRSFSLQASKQRYYYWYYYYNCIIIIAITVTINVNTSITIVILLAMIVTINVNTSITTTSITTMPSTNTSIRATQRGEACHEDLESATTQ